MGIYHNPEQEDSYDVYEFLASCANLYGDLDFTVTPDNVHKIEGSLIIEYVEEALEDENIKSDVVTFAEDVLECLYRTKEKEENEDLSQNTNYIQT